MQYWGVGLNWFDWLLLVLAVVAVLEGLAVLIPAGYQLYLDRWSKWPYDTPFIGRLQSASPWEIALAFRFDNTTSKEAFFEVRYLLEGDSRRFLPHQTSVWPSQEKVGLWVSVPPKSSREIRVNPFGPEYGELPGKWTIQIVEYRHRMKPVILGWPKELDRLVDIAATDIPPPTS